MESRLTLNALLESILESENVYAQPPESIEMEYPAIKYSLADFQVRFANNSQYSTRSEYTITLIDNDLDSPYVDKLHALPYCSFDRYYPAEGLHHWVFTLYY